MKVLISIPNTGWIHKHVVFAIQKLERDTRYEKTIILPTHNPYENNLHHIVNDVLQGNYTHWLNIDSDNPPMKNPLDLIELDKDIIGCPTPVWHFDEKNKKKGERPIYWNVYDYVKEKDAYKEHQVREGLQKADAVGTGCVLIKRKVLEEVRGGFTRQLNPDGTVNKGNDISFCERARDKGFEIYAHYEYPCMHFKEIELNEVVRAFKNLYE